MKNHWQISKINKKRGIANSAGKSVILVVLISDGISNASQKVENRQKVVGAPESCSKYTTTGLVIYLICPKKNNNRKFQGIWLHIEGDNTPLFNGDGYVTGTDRDGTLIPEMKKYLDAAQARNILVVFVLWNGAVLRNQVNVDLLTLPNVVPRIRPYHEVLYSSVVNL